MATCFGAGEWARYIDRVGLQLVSVGGVGVGIFLGAWVVVWVDKAHGAKKKMIHQIEPY